MEFYADMHEVFSIYLMNYLFDMVCCMCVNIRLKLMCVISNLNYASISLYMTGCCARTLPSPNTIQIGEQIVFLHYMYRNAPHVAFSYIHVCWTLYNTSIKLNSHHTNLLVYEKFVVEFFFSVFFLSVVSLSFYINYTIH